MILRLINMHRSYLDSQTVEWRRRYDAELGDLFNRPNMVNEIKKKNVHGTCMEETTSMVRIVFQENPKEKSWLGRPRLVRAGKIVLRYK